MSGEIDLVSAPKFEAAVRRAARIGTPNLVFHVDQVSFMDARGLRVFALAIRLLGERHVTVIGASRALRRLLELAGLGRRLVLEEWAR